jgi:autoinducer 2 (AI-2) kinase
MSGFVLADERSTTKDRDSRRDFVRSMYESHAFAVRGNCEQLEDISEVDMGNVVVCGGWSTSDFWVQMLADVLCKPVLRPAVAEATSIGTAVCAGVGAGLYKTMQEGVDALVRRQTMVEPNEVNRDSYDQVYQAWRRLRSLALPQG